MTSAVVVHVLLNCLHEHGVRPGKIERKSGLKLAEIENSEFNIPLEALLSLWKLAIEVTGDPALGIHLRQTYGENLSHFANHISFNSENGLVALENFIRYASLICEAHQFELIADSGLIRINYTNTSPDHQNDWMPEYNLSSLVYYGRKFVHENLCPETVLFQHRCPTDPTVYEEFFRAPVLFEQGENRLVYQEKRLMKPNEAADPHLQAILKKKADQTLERQAGQTQLATKVQQHIVAQISSGTLSFESTAKKFRLSRSSLYRALKDEGTSFKSILVNTRKSLAESYLEQGLKASQIAYLTGYADNSSFLNAFKLWFGESPGSYRQKQLKC